MIRVKKAFTLIELILVVVLISIIYSLTISTSPFKLKNEKEKFNLKDVKSFLLENEDFSFSNKISLVCVEKKFTCYVKIDGNVNEGYFVENVFKNIPDVYKYSSKEEKIEFLPIRIKDEDQNVIFEFEINNDFKSKGYILDTLADKVYVFNPIFRRAKVFESLGEVFESFEKNKLEVKDAF